MEKKAKPGRINASIGLPSPTLQTFLKNIIFDDEAYLVFLENPKGAMSRHGLEIAGDVTGEMVVAFRFTIERIRNAVRKSRKKLHFEDIFRLPLLEIDAGRIRIREVAVAAAASTDIYYSDTKSESNRGRSTEFDPKTEAVANSKTESWSTTKFSGSSIFPDNIRERFDRTPLLSADTLKKVIDSVAIKF
ncbi:MAG: hypothetical protein FJZ79_03490 [Chlorobi bacterium]|nr:hypothetical protein [Chlorobiota bacterium]